VTVLQVSARSSSGRDHGTMVTGVIWSASHGVAPKCTGIVASIYGQDGNGELLPCSQLDLARAITEIVEAGARVVNISGGELSGATEPEPLLSRAFDLCVARDVLVVAAAGNDGCACSHIPASAPTVLAVGAVDHGGRPMGFSN
jgi:subtilisin family serine protease